MGETPPPGLKKVTGMAGEPLLAVYEDDASEPTVFGCGATEFDPTATSNPLAIRVERFSKGVLTTGPEVELAPSLRQAFAGGNCSKGSACMPWVRATRDPNTFLQGLARARALGRIDSAKKIHSIFVGDKQHPGPAITEDQEVFYVVMLDTQLYVRGIGEISRGARDRVMTPIPDILRLPIIEGAMTFVIVHNHPSGDVKPSTADIEITKSIEQAALAVEVPLFDHVIVGPDRFYSFYEHKHFRRH